MSYDICKKCERFFPKNGKQYCPKCDEALSDSHSKIRDYLEQNPNASILEIVTEIGIELKHVNIFLEQGGASYKGGFNESEFLSPREKEIQKEEEEFNRREREKIKHKFTPRSIRR